TRTHREHIRATHRLLKERHVRQRKTNQLRSSGRDRGDVFRCDRGGHQSRAHPQAGLSGQPDGPRHTHSSTDEHDTSEVAFVRRTSAPRQGVLNLGLDDPFQPRPVGLWIGGREFEIVEEDGAGKLGTVAYEESRFQSDERHRAVSAYRLPERDAGIAVETGRHIKSEDRATRSVYCSNLLGKILSNPTMQPRSQNGVYDHVAIL